MLGLQNSISGMLLVSIIAIETLGQSGGFTNGVLLAGQRPGPRLKVS